MKNLYTLLILAIWFTACTPKHEETTKIQIQDPLPSWNEGATKQAIVDFVSEVTNPDSESFVAPGDRIATFDNDGNLWSEQPLYFQLFYAIDRIKAEAENHPEWNEKEPFKSVLKGDMGKALSYGEHGIVEMVMGSHAGMSNDAFQTQVKDWLSTSKHPRFDKPYNELIYQPMLELLVYLRANDFKTFIVSGGGIEFMRAWVEEAYGIPSDQVIGSSIKTELVEQDGKLVIQRLPELDFIDDKEGKPIGINKFIGKRPIFASGNSDGDLPMIQWTTQGEGPRFGLYVHHTDSVREWAYDRESSIGRLDKGLDEAAANGWTVIDMQRDWKVVYPFELKEN